MPNEEDKEMVSKNEQALIDDLEFLRLTSKAAVDVVRWARAVLSSDERGQGVLYVEAMNGMHLAIRAYDKNVEYWEKAIPVRAMKRLGWDQAMKPDGMYRWVKYDSDSGACQGHQGGPEWFEDIKNCGGRAK